MFDCCDENGQLILSKSKSDKKIIAAIHRGIDDKIFEELYVRIFFKVKHLILKSGGDEEEARDIFQDAVLTFYKQVKKGNYKHETEIDGYIYMVSRNAWYNRLKIKNRQTNIDDVREAEKDTAENPEIEYFDQEKSKYINKLLGDLGERCKDLLTNTIFLGLSMREICEKMGFSSENSAKTKHYKCKQRLIKVVKSNKEIEQILRS